MLNRLLVAAALASGASAASRRADLHPRRPADRRPGQGRAGPSTIIVDNGRIVSVRDGHVAGAGRGDGSSTSRQDGPARA